MSNKGSLIYSSNGHIYFNEGELVYKSIHKYELKATHDICFEYKIFGLPPEPQPRLQIPDIVTKLNHPINCV